MLHKPSQQAVENAEIIALMALDFLAQDPDRLGRFITLTGIGPAELRQGAGSHATLAAVLEHLLQDESLMLVFCSLNAIEPASLAPAHAVLADPEPLTSP